MTPSEVGDEMRRLSNLLDKALTYLREQVVEYADAEQEYRQAKARAWVATQQGTAKQREAVVDGATAPERRRRDLADGMRQAALEAVRSRRGQISALQTMANAHKEEAAFARTGPR